MEFGLREFIAVAVGAVLYTPIDWILNQLRLGFSTARGKSARDTVRLVSLMVAIVIGAIVWAAIAPQG